MSPVKSRSKSLRSNLPWALSIPVAGTTMLLEVDFKSFCSKFSLFDYIIYSSRRDSLRGTLAPNVVFGLRSVMIS